MKKHLFTFVILFLGISVIAKTFNLKTKSTFDNEITFENYKIKYVGKCLGKFQILNKKVEIIGKEKLINYKVAIVNNDGDSVATYVVVLNTKKKETTISDASLKTKKDNVTHNASNFLKADWPLNQTDEENTVPQLENVIKYLMSYNYL